MEIKKTKRASLEKHKSVFTLFGMILTLSIVWFTFEYKTYDRLENEYIGISTLNVEEDLIMQTKRIERPPPPPPIQQTTILEIVNNKTKVKDIIDIDVETNVTDIIALQVVEQIPEETGIEEKIFVFVEEQPEYPGGDQARLQYLSKAIVYPEMAVETKTQGTVYVCFVVEKDGKISNVVVRRGIGGGCDAAAINAIKRMPPWKAGKQRGRAVRVQFNMPVKFILEN